MRHILAFILIFCAWPSSLAAQPNDSPAFGTPARFDPVAEYVTPGQDEPGYRRWLLGATWRATYVRAFHNYLTVNGVSGVAPTWQLLRTASQWQRCAAEPFEVPPTSEWANIVATLNYIGTHVIPRVGPVEPVSVYRNPTLNDCAGGAAASTHREMGAIDMVPLRPTTRTALMNELCTIHLATARATDAGLGFYKGIRFHIDARKHREWGTQGARGGYGCVAVIAEGASPYMVGSVPIQPPSALSSIVLPPVLVPSVDPLAADQPLPAAPAADPLLPTPL